MDQHVQEALPIGTLISSGKRTYRIEEVLGAGGFGITYKVSTEIMVDNVPVVTHFALKELFVRNYCQRDGEGIVTTSSFNAPEIENCKASFLSEAKRLTQLSDSNGNIVRVNENFSANGTSYYVMEFLDGPSLRSMVQKNGAPLSWQQTVRLMAPIADTLAYLHDNRINHLDIKPDNIILDSRKNNRPVLIDFGLSKHYDTSDRPTSIIRITGYSAGYSPMEQYVGLSSFSPQADIYAFAATLLYLLTGKDPVVATQMNEAYIYDALEGKAPDYAIRAFVKALQVLPEHRTASIREFMESIVAPGATVASGADGGAPPTKIITPTNGDNEKAPPTEYTPPKPINQYESPKPKSKSKLPLLFIALGLVAIIVCVVIFSGGWGSGKAVYADTDSIMADSIMGNLIATEAVEDDGYAPLEMEDLDSYYEAADYYENANEVILWSPSEPLDSYDCHFFRGAFSYKDKLYPIKIAFLVSDSEVKKAVYKNLDYGTVIRMDAEDNRKEIVLRGKDGSGELTISLVRSNNRELIGTASNSNFTMDVTLTPTAQGFSF